MANAKLPMSNQIQSPKIENNDLELEHSFDNWVLKLGTKNFISNL
jgi:hypothetical protein